jgi:hypothetical protein
MNKYSENLFFSSACKALINEDKELRQLFSENELLYTHQHNGISCLFETTTVYTVFKGLLKNKFPLEIYWEHSYPGSNKLKADLALIKEDQSIDSLIEFKIWRTEDGREIRSDVEKYKNLKWNCDKYLFVVEYSGGEIFDNSNYLLAQNPEIELINMEQFSTFFYEWTEKQRVDKSVYVYFFKMKG